MSALADLEQKLLGRHVDVEGHDPGARDHGLARGQLAELEYVSDHLGLVVVDGARALAFVDQDFHLGLGDSRGRDGVRGRHDPASHQATQQRQRCGEGSCEQLEGPEQAQRDDGRPLGRSQGDALEHLGRQTVAKHRCQRRGERRPCSEHVPDLLDEQRSAGRDSDHPKHQPPGLHSASVLDVSLQRRAAGALEGLSERGLSRARERTQGGARRTEDRNEGCRDGGQ